MLSNVVPREAQALCHRFFAGDVAGAAALQCKLLPLVNALFSEVNPIPVNAALAAMGFGKGGVRLPLTPMEESRRAALLAEIETSGGPGMKIIINGAAGAMGLELRRLLEVRYADGEVAALVDSRGGENVYTGFSQVPEVQGTVLDFSFHTATRAAVDYAVSHKLPLVVGTTGHTEEERAHILAAAQQVPLFTPVT